MSARVEQAGIEAWCASYVAAFNAFDAGAIERHWVFPALIVQRERRLVFETAERFSANTDMLLGFYRRQNVARVTRSLSEHLVMGDGLVSVTVSDVMQDAGGAEIVSWQAAYLLQKVAGAWKAAVAYADGEVSAWAARATPLGKG